MKKFLIFLFFFISENAFSETIFSVGYIPDIPIESSYELGHDSDFFTTFTVADVDFSKKTHNNLFLQVAIGSHLLQKRLYNIKEQFMYNVGMTLSIDKKSYINIGGGFYSRNTKLKNDVNIEKEEFLNFHLDYNRSLSNKIFTGISIDSSLSKIGMNIGFKFN